MNTPDSRPTDEQLAILLATIDKDAPPPDRAFLDRLRQQSLDALQTATPQATPASHRKRLMTPYSFRWIAASAAAILVLGIVIAQWIIIANRPLPVERTPEEQFVINDTLTDDGRIGKVTDAQGVVSVKPVLHERWSPVQPRLVLKPGDWLRTDSRGANAAALSLLKATSVIVGPHSTVELVKANEIRLFAGEIEITADASAPVELHGPDKQKRSIQGKQLFRVEKEKLVRVEKEPLWLQGFKGTTANESIGSLIATVDGRDVPLTVGYHHVTIDVRDQIARTVIEESFVNHSPTVLEGVFYFPLPQDASISGFGMWIGDQLVEADVVEKQRAREIYETILREKRDPGLLEWTGGNVFKARVYPIPGRSEKRIKISYTQVLPLQGNRYRYSYGLQSELLRQHPLHDLKIDLTVNSVVPLRSVSSPTHPARIAKTEHSGHVEFSAQEYVPTRDFEAVIEVEGSRPDVVVIPHRRGEDGYFMVQFTPPGSGGDWERPLIPNGEPLRLLLLADTSASMDRGQRTTQNAVLASLLGTLTPKDVVNVAACDVNCDWIFEKPVPATAANLATIEQVLSKRSSLGWTDLDRAFASAMTMSDKGTHVVYVGDGIVTTGDADPVAFARRLHRLYEGKTGTFHAVTVGSTYEPAALKAIASLGGGSVRRVTGERGPQAAALELLTEIATPALRNLKVEFTGLRTARVYPETLPNVAMGTQQILLGRYLPDGQNQSGEIIVTGMLGNKPVRYVAKVALQDAEQGNSFIPRLWARMHLDRLLEQGTSDAVKQDVISLSEEFHLLTPYTSLLVLESDADRERFAVKRRFQMRDGEKFFAEGRDNASFELKQKQMKQAGDYRTALRRKVLAQLMTLGRDVRLFQFEAERRAAGRGGRYALAYDSAPGLGVLGDTEGFGLPLGSIGGGGFGGGLQERGEPGDSELLELDDKTVDLLKTGSIEKSIPRGGEDEFLMDGHAPIGMPLPHELFAPGASDGLDDLTRDVDFGLFGDSHNPVLLRREIMERAPRSHRSQLQWLGSLFPTLSAPATQPREPKQPWPAPALALSRSLVRLEKPANQKGGLVLMRQSDVFDVQRNELLSRSKRLELVSPRGWLGRTMPEGGPVMVSWCDAATCGTYSIAFELGRVRAANKLDLQRPPLELGDDSLTALHVTYAHVVPTVETIDKERALLILKYRDNPDYELRFVIDVNRHVVISSEHRSRGKVYSSTRFSDFVEVAGSWWARTTETFNDKDQRQSLTKQTIAEASADEIDKRIKQELAGKDRVLFLRQPLPRIPDARAAVATGKATFDDRAVLTLHFAATQQWVRALEQLNECERLAAGKPGMRWLRDAFLLASRRHEELRKRFLDEAAALTATTDADVLANEYFLAQHLIRQAQQVLQTNEILILSDSLRKIYERQPAHLHARKNWRSYQVSLLQQAGQFDKALPLAKELASEYPRDADLQHRYAQALASNGDYPAAYAWLNRVLGAGAKWEPTEEESLRWLFAGLLQQQGRYRELADYLGAWVARSPESEQCYAQYLSALVRSDQAGKAETLVAQWLREAQVPGELPPPVAARLSAAVNFALGQGYNLHTNRIEERWFAPLAQTALFFARHDPQLNIASMILHHPRFHSTDAALTARKTLVGILIQEIDLLTVAQIDHIVNWVWSDSGMERSDWKKLAERLYKRWTVEKKHDVQHQLAQPLVRILSWLGPEELLPFLRIQWKEGPQVNRIAYVNQLFTALLTAPWSPAIEDEAFTLLDSLADPDEPASGLLTRVAALHRLTDAMLAARYQALTTTIEHPEKLTRIELQKKQEEFRKLAREGFADRLRKQTSRHAKPLANWLLAERLWIDVLLERNPQQIAEECWLALETPAPKARPDDDDSVVETTLSDVLRERFLVMLQNLAARKGANATLIERLLKYLDRESKDHPDDGRWRAEKYRLLIALDRYRELESLLKQWVSGPDPENRWRLALGYLLAEQGRIAEAITLFEAVEAANELTPGEYRSLAGWYQVENRREQHEKAQAAIYKTTDERHLSHRIQIHLNPWLNTGGHLPRQFDPEVLQVFKVLFEKAATPQNYLWQLQQFYQASRDFRLLAMLADGVVGHSAGKIYPFLQGMQSVLGEVRDEATADELVARIARVRPSARTPIDQRALDLMELLVERRAAEVQNQAGPHADRALAALQRAFKHQWSPGEPRLMADFLGSLGRIPQPALGKEQLRQLEVLHREAATGTFDRLQIALREAETLHAYARGADAMDLLQLALKEYEDASGGTLPTSANTALDTLISFTENAHHYDRGEKLLLAQLSHPVHPEQKNWLVRRINGLYLHALKHGGDVSLGKGATLYKALETKLYADLNVIDLDQRHALLINFSALYRTAQEQKLAGVGADLRAFAFKRLPPFLKEQVNNYEQIVRTVADVVHDVLGAREGIAFLLDRTEDEPGWLRYNNQDVWTQWSHKLAEWRLEVKNLGDLEPRLVRVILAELRRDLRSREARYRTFYDRRHNYYWPEKEGDFARLAEEVLAEMKPSSATVEYVAEYLFWGLPREKRAIEILLTAHEQKRLAESGQWQLVDYLHRQDRFAESIPLLLPLVEKRPENVGYRTKLMHAYYRTGKQAELLALLKQTDGYFHEKDRWNEGVLAALASSCLENHLFPQSVAYYEELIPLHQRTQPRRGIGDGILSSYYSGAARAYSGLGKTREAVEKASGAVVSWAPNQEQRKGALEALVEVLMAAPDLPLYVSELDKEKLQSAIVRKAIGQAYVRKNDHARAIAQLQLAAELQPNDAEIYQLLLTCYDKIGDRAGAVRQLLEAIELSRRDVTLYEQLGRRLGELNQPVEAERAYTSIVEVLPNESESHTLLAEIREKQNRWSDAIAQWQRVVQTRALEPTGLLKLAAAQLHERAWDSAATTLHKLRSQSWPQRFGNVEDQVRVLEKKLEERPRN